MYIACPGVCRVTCSGYHITSTCVKAQLCRSLLPGLLGLTGSGGSGGHGAGGTLQLCSSLG